MNAKIRRYEEKDHAILLDTLRLLTPQYFDPSEEKDFVEYLDKELERYFVLEVEEQVIGAGGINFGRTDRKTAYISWDLIHPDLHGQGLGKQLTQFRIQEIRKVTEVERIVVRTSQTAYKFYEKNGFQLIRVERDFWAEGFDLYEMEMPSR